MHGGITFCFSGQESESKQYSQARDGDTSIKRHREGRRLTRDGEGESERNMDVRQIEYLPVLHFVHSALIPFDASMAMPVCAYPLLHMQVSMSAYNNSNCTP